MENFFYKIVAPDMVWLHYYDEYKTKHFRELLGKEAREFIESMQSFAKDLANMLDEEGDE
ncbi:hypothetical protein DYBT9275_00931 [Dyadobacter sp. CECT 9275]|uniref:Uncharacterized protein n=1 Tax=Dyadobacter helix TaxID=2822344 RepID=A0A916J9A5_9BACT|nr:hypothetical protein [Dyadobacter sp. CECT 9275]CAG4992286.1 hypothetical protein DYBT9275_00931 [Dyadobacter sp. CECT 9275]